MNLFWRMTKSAIKFYGFLSIGIDRYSYHTSRCIDSNLYCSTDCELCALTEAPSTFFPGKWYIFLCISRWIRWLLNTTEYRMNWWMMFHFFYYSLSEVLNWRWRWVDGFTMALEYSKGIIRNEARTHNSFGALSRCSARRFAISMCGNLFSIYLCCLFHIRIFLSLSRHYIVVCHISKH